MRTRQQGFTLIEIVVVITLSAIVMGFMSLFLAAPVHAYFAQERRSGLTDSSNNAMRMLEADIRTAVPESVRVISVGTNRAIEMLYAEGVARYHMGNTNPADLNITANDTTFTTFGQLAAPGALPGNYYLVINHGTGGNAYSRLNVTTPAGTAIQAGPVVNNQQVVTFDRNVRFTSDSPTKRVYLVSQAISYVCDLAAGTITRYWNYGLVTNQATVATGPLLLLAGASSSLVARNVTACTFNTTAGNTVFGGLVRMRMTFNDSGDALQVFDQAQVEYLR